MFKESNKSVAGANICSVMESRVHLKNGASLKSQMSREYQSLSVKGTDVKQNVFMSMLKFCVVLLLMCFSCETIIAQVQQQKLPTQTIVQPTKSPFIINHYKDSYSNTFMCRIEAAILNTSWEPIFVGCDDAYYSDGYEDGYNEKEEKYVEGMNLKNGFKAVLVSSSDLSNTTPEELSPFANNETKLAVKELSYKNGYSDGNKDIKKEKKDIDEAKKQGKEVIYAGQNKKYKEMYKRNNDEKKDKMEEDNEKQKTLELETSRETEEYYTKGKNDGDKDTYEIGDYYSKNGISGIVYKLTSDKKHGMLISLQESNQNWFSASGWCESIGSGWHLPSINDLHNVYNEFRTIWYKVNNNLQSKGGITILVGTWECDYGSSTRDNRSVNCKELGWSTIWFGTNYVSYICLNWNARIRAVREF
jgi:hypothetical protein